MMERRDFLPSQTDLFVHPDSERPAEALADELARKIRTAVTNREKIMTKNGDARLCSFSRGLKIKKAV